MSLQDDLLQEILEVGPLELDHLQVAISRHNIRIVCGGHHQVVEDALPPLLGPVMDDVVTHHLVHEVNPFHVFLVVGLGCRDHARVATRLPLLSGRESWTGHTLALCPATLQRTARPSVPPCTGASPVLHSSAAGQSAGSYDCSGLCHMQVRQQVSACVKVVEVHLRVLPVQVVDKVCHKTVCQTTFLSSRCPAGVHLELGQVTSVTFCKDPHLDAPLDQFHWQVLAKSKSALELDHTFIYRVRHVLIVQKVNKPPYLHELVSFGNCRCWPGGGSAKSN